MSLDDRLTVIFEAILEDYDRRPPDQRRRLTHHRSFQRETFIDWDMSKPAVTRDDLDELAAYGFIDLEFGGRGDYLVKPTLEGRRAYRTVQRERARGADAARGSLVGDGAPDSPHRRSTCGQRTELRALDS